MCACRVLAHPARIHTPHAPPPRRQWLSAVIVVLRGAQSPAYNGSAVSVCAPFAAAHNGGDARAVIGWREHVVGLRFVIICVVACLFYMVCAQGCREILVVKCDSAETVRPRPLLPPSPRSSASPLLIVSHSERAPFLAGTDVVLCCTRPRQVCPRPSFPVPPPHPPECTAPRSCSTSPQLQSHASRFRPLSRPASSTPPTARTISASIRPSHSALSVFISRQHSSQLASLSHRCPLCRPWLLMF